MKQRFLPFHPRIIKDYCGHDIAKLRDERANFSLETRIFNLEREIRLDNRTRFFQRTSKRFINDVVSIDFQNSR